MILSGATLTVLILKASILKTLFQCLVAMMFLFVLGFFFNFGIVDIATNGFLYWLPVICITLLFKKNSSFTLTVQLLSIISILFLILTACEFNPIITLNLANNYEICTLMTIRSEICNHTSDFIFKIKSLHASSEAIRS